MMTKIEKLLVLPQKIFSVQDLSVIWEIKDQVQLWNQIRYYLRTKKLIRLHKGVYSVGKYDEYELAQKLIVPSYISVYTALARHGIIFQYYQTIHSMALISKNIHVDNQGYTYHKLKDDIFYDSTGIEKTETYQLAGPERAICDTLYLYPHLGFDNLRGIDPEKLHQVALIYKNQRLIKEIDKYIEWIKSDE